MGNLGLYQDIVVEAKSLGGVDNLILAVEKAAVAKAAPRTFAAGAAAATVALTAAALVWKGVSDRQRKQEEEASAAKAVLTESIGREAADVADVNAVAKPTADFDGAVHLPLPADTTSPEQDDLETDGKSAPAPND